MPPLTKDLIEKIEKTHDRVTEISTVLLGTNGDNGLCGDFKRATKRLSTLEKSFYIAISLIVGSGILGGISAAIINALK